MRVSSLPPGPGAAWKEAFSQAVPALPDSDLLAQIFLEEREDLRVVVEDGAVGDIVRTRTRGLSARTRARFLYRSNPDPDDALRLVRAISTTGPELSRAANPRPPVPSPSDPVPHVVRILQRLTQRAARGNPARALASWVSFGQHVLIGRPGLGLHTDARSARRVRLEVRIDRRGAHAVAVGERVLPAAADEVLDDLAAEVVRRAEERLDARPAPGGDTAVVFSPGVGGILLHEIVGHALESDTVLAGASALAASAAAIAHPEVTVVDDPRRGRASWRIDDEGEEARATMLVQGGRIAGWISDLRRAARSGRPPTGHGRRANYHQPVLPRMGCTFLAPGRLDADEILRQTGTGILVRRMEAAAADPSAGTAVFRVTDADRIHRGAVNEPLAPFLLRANAPQALESLDRIADDLLFDTCIGSCVRDGQPLATSVGAPTFRIGVAAVVSSESEWRQGG